MEFFNNPVRATFKGRNNRFSITCTLFGKTVTAFLPNPGRLWELLIPGAEVYLESADATGRRTEYTAVAVKRRTKPVVLHTHRTNDVAEALLARNLVPGLEDYEIIKREVRLNRSRFDFLLGKGSSKLYLEVKSCTLFGKKVAMFPDAVTSRGKRHLEELAALGERNVGGAVLFVVHSMSPDYFLPEFHTDPNFSRTFLDVKEKLPIIPLSVDWREDLTLGPDTKLLTIPWRILEDEGEDRGSYLAVMRIRRSRDIGIGKLGTVRFEKGYYIYVGSARKHLLRRIDRHRRLRKQMHWHIDYLRAKAEFVTALPVRTKDDVECMIARKLGRIADRKVPSFGASDCACPSHLFRMKDNPIHSPKFHRMLQHIRMDRFIKDT